MNRKSLVLFLVLLLAALLGACRGEIKQNRFQPPERQEITGSDNEEGDQGEEETGNIHCTDQDPHPMGESIAEKFEVSYEQVMTWYCGGYAFSDILLSLETTKLVENQSAERLLERLEAENWEEIWADLDVRPE